MSKTKIIIIVAIAIVIVYGVFAFDIPYRKSVDDFATCAAAGFPVLTTFPEQCTDADGHTYVNSMGDGVVSSDKIVLESPISGATISFPVTLSGQARGTWFFEASFPVEIIAFDGTVIASTSATASSKDGSWMTSAFVPWKAVAKLDSGVSPAKLSGTHGFIRLKKDNPSGDPSRDEHIDVPIVFATSTVGVYQ